MIPVVSYFHGDFIPLLLLANEEGTVADMAAACAAEVVGKRVAPKDAQLWVEYQDQRLDGQTIVSAAGIGPMDTVYVGYA